MKPSEYNYIIPFGNKTIFFNGITESFFCVSNENADPFNNIINNPDINLDDFPDFIENMKSRGFIIDDDTDEPALVNKKFHDLTCPSQYYLMVLPTYQCNLRCWYCIQDHENLWMSDEVKSRVKRLIERKMSDETIRHLHLAWFGGEPLMAYNTVIELTLFARDLAASLGKVFTCAITTNGTLLNEERIEALHEAGVSSYQITIDGDRETHNKIKVLGKASAYDTTLQNINLIAKHTRCYLRLNYNKDNLHPEEIINSLKSVINPDVIDNITFMMFKVWQENYDTINEEDVKTLFALGKQMGMYTKFALPGMCYADHVHYDCVFPNGHVGKCDNHSPEETPGILQDDGTVLWTKDMTEIYKRHDFDEYQSDCGDCRYLPLCCGPCVAKRERMLNEYGKVRCMYEDRDTEMKRLILNECITLMQKADTI